MSLSVIVVVEVAGVVVTVAVSVWVPDTEGAEMIAEAVLVPGLNDEIVVLVPKVNVPVFDPVSTTDTLLSVTLPVLVTTTRYSTDWPDKAVGVPACTLMPGMALVI